MPKKFTTSKGDIYTIDTPNEENLFKSVINKNTSEALNYILSFGNPLPDNIKTICYFAFDEAKPNNVITLNNVGTSHSTLSLIAVINNDFEMLNLLITFGFDINSHSGINYITPLGFAADKGYVEIVKLLCEQDGIKVQNGLFYAIRGENKSKSIEIIDLLVQKGAIIEPEHIELAISHSNLSTFEYLFKKKLPDIEKNNLKLIGSSPDISSIGYLLGEASKYQNTEVIKFLLNSGYKPEQKYIDKSFVSAADNGRLKTCITLKANIEEHTRLEGLSKYKKYLRDTYSDYYKTHIIFLSKFSYTDEPAEMFMLDNESNLLLLSMSRPLRSKLSSKDSYIIHDAIKEIFNNTHLNIKELELARFKARIEFIKITTDEDLVPLSNKLAPLFSPELIHDLSKLEEELFPEVKLAGLAD
ncbi:hypothetical protein H6P87_01055 [Rickettsia tillamookensis]|uniref:Ankyrin repeat protein n=1 Tax=Rickettsia tillamookensis TaxID=2761623 RepID=A0A9E6MIN1_9RICK|nr:ankyrin repeat domain-containing protein [Rickettsia tillamookensis]QQV75495.1 hypothetical protein H6P87_01055 [Rickettsia tillamookensis]